MNRGNVRPAPDLRPIAADLLGIDPETPAGVAQASLLRRLADHGFAPDPMTVDAVRVLSGQRVAPFGDLESALRISCEEQRSAEVEAFAAEFFDVPVASRLDRFSAPETACRGHLRLLSRLSGLRPGLTVARPAADAGSPEVRRLVAHVLELFVMPPGPRAARSRELAAAWRNDPNLRNATRFGARKRFRAQHPAIAALDPPFLGRLDPPARPRLPSRARARVSKILGTRITGGLGSGGGNYAFPIIIIVVVNLLRLAGRSGGN